MKKTAIALMVFTLLILPCAAVGQIASPANPNGAASGLTRIDLSSPPDGSEVSAPPTFAWTPDGGTANVYVLTFYSSEGAYLWTTPILAGTNWTPPASRWESIPVNTTLYWTAWGADLSANPSRLIASDDVWQFEKIDSIRWSKTFGGENIGICYRAQQTSDGGYIAVGRLIPSQYIGEVYLVKTDAFGNEEWSKTFDGTDILGYSVQQTTDGGYIITGGIEDEARRYLHVLLLKTDPVGNEQWRGTFGSGDYQYGQDVQQTSDGGYIVVGVTDLYGSGDYDVWLIKTDSEGNEQWNKIFGGPGIDGGESVQQTNDGGYITAGFTDSYGSGDYDVWLIKTDALGNEQWEKTFGGTQRDGGKSVQQTTDGGYIIAGSTNSFGKENYNVLIIKTDRMGNREWINNFGGPRADFGKSVQQTTDGGYVVVGDTASYALPPHTNLWLIKMDRSGKQQWSKVLGGREDDHGESVRQTSDGGYILAGSTESFATGIEAFWLIKTDGTGNAETP